MEERKYYHYVFSTYNRKFLLNERGVKDDLKKWFHDIAEEKQFEIIALAILADHVHILIEQKANDSSSYVMKCIKGASSHMFFKNYPNTDRYLFRKLWGSSYNCKDVDPSETKEVIYYIKNQTDKRGVDKRFIGKVNKEPRRLASGS
jgi:putative transposase